MEIKRLNVEDIDEVKDMFYNFRSKNTTHEKIERFLENNNNYLIACLENEKVIGFVLAYKLQRYDEKNDMIYIHEVGVLEEYRRLGIGKKLMEYVKDICKEENLSKIFLITNKSNIPAVSLYESTDGKEMEDDNVVYWYDNIN